MLQVFGHEEEDPERKEGPPQGSASGKGHRRNTDTLMTESEGPASKQSSALPPADSSEDFTDDMSDGITALSHPATVL